MLSASLALFHFFTFRHVEKYYKYSRSDNAHVMIITLLHRDRLGFILIKGIHYQLPKRAKANNAQSGRVHAGDGERLVRNGYDMEDYIGTCILNGSYEVD